MGVALSACPHIRTAEASVHARVSVHARIYVQLRRQCTRGSQCMPAYTYSWGVSARAALSACPHIRTAGASVKGPCAWRRAYGSQCTQIWARLPKHMCLAPAFFKDNLLPSNACAHIHACTRECLRTLPQTPASGVQCAGIACAQQRNHLRSETHISAAV